MTVEQLEAARTDRTTVLVFVSPSNPTGSVYTPEETRAIGEWALEHGIWVITDEIYQNLVYEGVRAVSIVEAVPALAGPDDPRQRRREDLRDDRLARGLDGRPRRRDQGRRQPAVAPRARTSTTSRSARPSPRSPGRRPRPSRCARPSTAAASSSSAELSKIHGVTVPNPLGAFYVYPDVTGLLGREWDGVDADHVARARRPRSSRRPRSRSFPVRPSARPATCACRTPSATTQLLEGVQRLQRLFVLTHSTPC